MTPAPTNVTPLKTRLQLFVEHVPNGAWREHLAGGAAAPRERLVLPFEHRQKARQRARLVSGREIGLRLPRGLVLRGGDQLRAADGTLVDVVAAPEPVSTVVSTEPRALARVAYHLGNRHVALEVGDGYVRYLRDHVLDAMCAVLGHEVIHERAPFEPEGGAYGAHRHAHGAEHSHGHGHAHDHSQDQAHTQDQAHSHDHAHGGHEHRLFSLQRYDPTRDRPRPLDTTSDHDRDER